MAGIIERLTEGIVNRDMRAEGHALLEKWETHRTFRRSGRIIALANLWLACLKTRQRSFSVSLQHHAAGGDVEGFAAVAFPIVRRVFAGLIANDLVSVQPMSLPSGLIFFLDFTVSPNLVMARTSTRLWVTWC